MAEFPPLTAAELAAWTATDAAQGYAPATTAQQATAANGWVSCLPHARVPTAPPSSGMDAASVLQQHAQIRQLLATGGCINLRGQPYVTKQGWAKAAVLCGVSFTQLSSEVVRDDKGHMVWASCTIRASLPGGRFSDSTAFCERTEKKFTNPGHDIPTTAETRAKNRCMQDLTGYSG
jgi:hypothetical protein